MTKAEKRHRKEGDELVVPNYITWTVDDWQDFCECLIAFNARFRKRHEKELEPKKDEP